MPGKEPADIDLQTGGFGYYRSMHGVVTHRFTNIGTSVFHAIGIELIGPMRGSSVTTPLADQAGLMTMVDSERVRAYRVMLAPGASLGPLSFAAPGLRVGLVDGTFEERVARAASAISLKPGQLQWRSAPVTYTISNTSPTPLSFIEYEFK